MSDAGSLAAGGSVRTRGTCAAPGCTTVLTTGYTIDSDRRMRCLEHSESTNSAADPTSWSETCSVETCSNRLKRIYHIEELEEGVCGRCTWKLKSKAKTATRNPSRGSSTPSSCRISKSRSHSRGARSNGTTPAYSTPPSSIDINSPPYCGSVDRQGSTDGGGNHTFTPASWEDTHGGGNLIATTNPYAGSLGAAESVPCQSEGLSGYIEVPQILHTDYDFDVSGGGQILREMRGEVGSATHFGAETGPLADFGSAAEWSQDPYVCPPMLDDRNSFEVDAALVNDEEWLDRLLGSCNIQQ